MLCVYILYQLSHNILRPFLTCYGEAWVESLAGKEPKLMGI